MTSDLVIGETIKVKYPREGYRNILANREGVVVKVGLSPKGKYVTIENSGRAKRKFTSMMFSRMVDLQRA